MCFFPRRGAEVCSTARPHVCPDRPSGGGFGASGFSISLRNMVNSSGFNRKFAAFIGTCHHQAPRISSNYSKEAGCDAFVIPDEPGFLSGPHRRQSKGPQIYPTLLPVSKSRPNSALLRTELGQLENPLGLYAALQRSWAVYFLTGRRCAVRCKN